MKTGTIEHMRMLEVLGVSESVCPRLYDEAGNLRQTIPGDKLTELYSPSMAWVILHLMEYMFRQKTGKKINTTAWKSIGGISMTWQANNQSLSVNDLPQLRYDLFTADLSQEDTLMPKLLASVFKSDKDNKFYAYEFDSNEQELKFIRPFDTLSDAQTSIEVLALVWISNGDRNGTQEA